MSFKISSRAVVVPQNTVPFVHLKKQMLKRDCLLSHVGHVAPLQRGSFFGIRVPEKVSPFCSWTRARANEAISDTMLVIVARSGKT